MFWTGFIAGALFGIVSVIAWALAVAVKDAIDHERNQP